MKISAEFAAASLSRTPATKRQPEQAADVKATGNATRPIVDTVELTESKAVAQDSRTAAQEELAAKIKANTPAASEASDTRASKSAPVDTLSGIQGAYGARAGDKRFNESFDLNGDGVINFADLNAALSAANEPPTGGPSPVEPPIGSSIDGLASDILEEETGDSTVAASGVPAPASAPQQAPADPIAGIQNAYGARAGDARFNESFDLNGDGVINFADLNAALSAANEPPTGGPSPVETPAGPSITGLGANLADDKSGEPTVAASDAPAPAAAPSQPEPQTPIYSSQDVDRVLSAFGSSAGDDAFIAEFDFDSDGVINFGDLNELLSRFNAQGGTQQTLLDQLTERFGAAQGHERFNAHLDFDGDGVINFTDLNTLLSNIANGLQQ